MVPGNEGVTAGHVRSVREVGPLRSVSAGTFGSVKQHTPQWTEPPGLTRLPRFDPGVMVLTQHLASSRQYGESAWRTVDTGSNPAGATTS